MNAIIAAIIAKAVSAVKGELQEGSYVVDETLTIHVKGTVNKGADYTRPATVSIPFKLVLALFAEKVKGIVQESQKDKVFALLVESMVDCMDDADAKQTAIKALLKDLEKAETEVESKLIAQLPEQKVSGRTTVGKDWSVEVITDKEKREAA